MGKNEIDTDRNSAKRRAALLHSFVLTCLVVGLASCSSIGTAARLNPSPTVNTPIPPSTPPRSDKPYRTSLIRRIDFGNFTYPSLPTGKCSIEQVRLVNGRYDSPSYKKEGSEEDCRSVEVIYVDYGDLNGDGIEDAIVVLYAEVGGNESREDVFLYTTQEENPKLLWKFATGDGANGGLKRVYADNGKLIVELYGLGAKVGKEVYGTNPREVGTCCPKQFTRTTYQWVVDRFQHDGESTVFSNPSESAVIEMPRYQLQKDS